MSGYIESRCFGRMCIPHDASAGAKGRAYSTTNVWGSGAAARFTCLKSSPYAVGVRGSIIRRYVNITSSEVKGAPSCHFTPFRRWKVILFPSGEISHDSASSPSSFRSLSYRTSPLKT